VGGRRGRTGQVPVGYKLIGMRDRSAGDTQGMSVGILRGLCLEEVWMVDFFCCALVGRFILKIAVC